eukprot:415479-Prorocentrum_minimum.AAC.1
MPLVFFTINRVLRAYGRLDLIDKSPPCPPLVVGFPMPAQLGRMVHACPWLLANTTGNTPRLSLTRAIRRVGRARANQTAPLEGTRRQ